MIDIFRKRRDEKVARVHPADRQRLRELANRAALWAKDHREGLSNAAPELPDCLYNRDQDNWRPLIAIADAAGGHWPQTVRRVAIGMNGRNEDPSEGVMLLADIRRIFNGKNSDRLTTENLLIALCADVERPWCEYDRGGQMTTRQFAGLIKMFGIRSSSVRIGDKTPKGYNKRARFEDAFERYLSPSQPPFRSATSATVSWINGVDGGEPQHLAQQDTQQARNIG